MKHCILSPWAGGIRALVMSLSWWLAVTPLHAQIVNDGATRTLVNITNTFTGDVTVGTNGAFTLLTFSDNAQLTNSAHGVIGRNATALSNEVQLLSATARWVMGNNLFVGSNGSGNRLVVSNGAFLNNNRGLLGNGASSSNNFALITGSGSLWTNRSDLTVGRFGRHNVMVISNGARVVSSGGDLGSQPGGSNNLVVVTGNGSVWSNVLGGWVSVGGGERGNRLIIEAGGRVSGDNGVVGTGAFGGDSEALVTGPGSLWSSRDDAVLGLNPSNNRLVVSNGATVTAGRNGRLGAVAGATNNVVVVTGAGSLWSNQLELYVGEGGPGNRMEVSDGGRVVSSNTYVGLFGASNLALVSGTGSLWSNRAGMFVGHGSGANQLVVSNGATVVVRDDFVVGFSEGSSSNSVTLTDAGTRLVAPEVNAFHQLGRRGSFNRLLVKNGALLNTYYSFEIGKFGFSSNNVAVVTDPATLWTNSISLLLGGNGDRLVVSNGAVLRTLSLQLDTSRGGEAVVTGAGSILESPGSLGIGQAGSRSSNRLVIEKGARVASGDLAIGTGNFSADNRVVVTDPGSVLSNQFLVHLSDAGSFGNALVVSNGATVHSGSASLYGSDVSNGGCDALVTGPGSTWNNLAVFTVGVSGNRNQLIVTNGGAVFSGGGLILGEQSNSINNRLVVSSGTLRVANASGSAPYDVRGGTNIFNAGLIEADHLVLTNVRGRFEFNGGTLITRGATINNNATFVVGNTGGTPAVWDVRAGPTNHYVAQTMHVGVSAPLAQLIHTNGALLTNSDYVILGVNAASRSNRATLAGPASRWFMRRGLAVGDSGSDNQLTVGDGASLITPDGSLLGIEAGSRNNEAVVSGAGTSWFGGPNGILQLGAAGYDNRLIVAAGGGASYGGCIVGLTSSSSNNLALITGPGSLWNLLHELRVGESGAANQLVVSNGAAVFTGGLAMLGADTTAVRNSALVTGPGSSWLINSNLFVGSNGALCQLVVTDGARLATDRALLGAAVTSSGNSVLLRGAGTLWTNTDGLGIGVSGSDNRMTVANGARFENQIGELGRSATSHSNEAIVTGPDSQWRDRDGLVIGIAGSGNRLVVQDGGSLVTASISYLGQESTSSNNQAVVTGPASSWISDPSSGIRVGSRGRHNRLLISDGSFVSSGPSAIGEFATSSDNLVEVTGPGSSWSVQQLLSIGRFGSGNRLILTNGGRLMASGEIGSTGTSSNNTVIVTGLGSSWTASSTLSVGGAGSANQLVIRDGGEVIQDSFGVTIGVSSASLRNRLLVDGGSLRLSNTNLGLGVLDVRRGTNVLNAGLMEAAQLLLTNAQGFFEFNGGTLSIGTLSIANTSGQQLRVGNGVSPATLMLTGDGSHAFGPVGVTVSSNGVLTGSGTASGALVIQPGGLLSPGASIGRLALTRVIPPTLLGTTLMEISKTGNVLTNDVLQVPSAILYGGVLIVSNAGPDTLAAGDHFRLFAAGGYSGVFTNLTLPPLASGLTWRNDFTTDGSITVVANPLPGFNAISLSGTSLILAGTNGTPGANYTVLASTNVALPLSNWTSIATRQFDAGGGFSFTNAIIPAIPQRFYRLRTP